MKKVDDFLTKHKLKASDIFMEDHVKIFTEDMLSGLEGRQDALRMIPTYIEAENEFLTETPVLAIDAGGTNFRAALVTVTASGNVVENDTVNYKMPGLDGEISANEFFRTVADYIRPIAEKVDRIGFCFSYPTEILPDKDGRLIQFCKEVQAAEVHGQLIGKRLLETLGTQGKKIVLLNDTVATLLAGKSASAGRQYDSFIGFILGTGTNTCYIEQNSKILKKRDLKQEGSQIINIESGDFRRPPQTDIDIQFCNSTADPGGYKFEKMFSGGYFGGLTLHVLKTAAKEGVFTTATAEAINRLTNLQTWDANSYIARQISQGHPIVNVIKECNDADSCRHIIDVLVDRAAKLVAGSMAAVILKCGKGKNPEKPILITIEGTTFYKLHNFRPRFESYLDDYLTGDRKRYIEFTEVDQSSLFGAALAGLID